MSTAGQTTYVYVVRAACPKCGSLKLKSSRSISNGDGSVTRPTKCRGCGFEFRLIVEIPSKIWLAENVVTVDSSED
jgi:predicted Zn-ribbon and HTH transcriptional regulator